MATAGQRFTMPDGSVYIVRHPAAESDGAFVEMEFVLPPGCVPAAAARPSPSGRGLRGPAGPLRRRPGRQWSTLAPGESASVPVGVLHTFRNRSGETVHVRNRHTPAMRFEEFIERTCRTLQAVGVKRKRDPRVPLYLSMVMLDFDETLYPGRARERLPMKALASIARRLPAPAS